MATIEICDVCECREKVNRLYYVYDRQMDGAGSSESVGDTFDLCQTHELIAIKRAIKDSYSKVLNEWEFNKLIIKHIKDMIKSYKKK